MKIMADLDAVHLGLDENEADIAEELQDFDESFDTRSEASDSESSDSQPSISSVSTAPSSMLDEEEDKNKNQKQASKLQAPSPPPSKVAKKKNENKKSATKRQGSPVTGNEVNDTTNGSANQNGGDNSRVETRSGAKKKKNPAEKRSAQSSGTDALESTTTTSAVGPGANDASASKKLSANNAKSGNSKKTTKKSTLTTAPTNAASSSNGSSSGPTGVSMNAANNVNTDSFRKSDVESDAEDRSATAVPQKNFESDSESEDSDSAANIKRNGRKAASKSKSPEKKNPTNTNASSSGKNKSYDYMTKLNYLFRDTRFFLIKSNNADNVALSKSKNVWATLPQNDANLNQAFKEARNVLLIFSVNESGKFAGFARMSAPSRRDIPQVAWVLPPSISAKALGGVIEIDWVCRKELSFNCTSHLYNSWNEGKPVKIGRDGQEIEPKVGAELCRLFPEDEKVEMTPILRKSKETAKVMREKGLRVIYKPPRSLSTRGGSARSSIGFRNGNTNSGGPMRHHKRIYGSGGNGPHRPYKIPSMGPPSSSYKRSSSPYRSSGSGPGSGSNNSRSGGDSNLPPWERYMTADYMRSMHGQLPPLLFVPPFAPLPLPSSGPGSTSLPPPGASGYEQLPPPVRYYDGPPLPDYPPPQPIRPPPPSFDKPPTYEDFAAWKNAGLPTVPPPGFPGMSTSNSSGNMSGGTNSNSNSSGPSSSHMSGSGLGGSSSGLGPHSYRNTRESSTSINRIRDRGIISSRDYHARIGERERHFRGGGSERGAHRGYKDSRR